MFEPLTVYTLPNCIQCTLTKRALDNARLDYTVVDLASDELAAEYVISLGHTSAPIVVTGAASWSGFQPDKITAVAATRASAPRTAGPRR